MLSTCTNCDERGKIRCPICKGKGDKKNCHACKGDRYIVCSHCGGSGKMLKEVSS